MFTEALGELSQDTQSELTAMFKQFLGDEVSVSSAATDYNSKECDAVL